MKRLGVLVLALALLAGCTIWAGQSAAQARALEQTLHATAQVTYDIRPDAGPVTVTWNVDIQNNDPQTAYREFGWVYYYDSYGVPMLRGASGVSASGPGGGALGVTVEDTQEGPIVGAVVHFDRNLHYGQSYSFSLSYQLPEARSDSLLVTPYYVFLPAIGGGDDSAVNVVVPDDGAWESTLEHVGCSESGSGHYRCGPSEYIPVAAIVEVSKPGALRSMDGSVSLSESEAGLSVRHFPGEEVWAEHVLGLAGAALPVLEDLFGFPYPGSDEIEIAERGQQELLGYGGVYRCGSDDPCTIGLHPLGQDFIVLHELAHSWTTVFEERWIKEGLAELMARRAARKLDPPIPIPQRPEAEDPVDLQLDVWRGPILMLTATDEEKDREHTGYAKSLRFMQILREAVGMEALQAVNMIAAERSEREQAWQVEMNSRQYLDALEEASGTRLDDLFLEWVFLPHLEPTLEERRLVREHLAELREAVDEAGLTLPPRIDDMIKYWRFGPAEEDLVKAEGALEAYNAARDKVEEPRSLLQKLGLLHKDPGARLAEASSAFDKGVFGEATERADEARDMIDGAGRAGLYRLLVALAMFLAVLGLSTGAVWFVRRRRRASR